MFNKEQTALHTAPPMDRDKRVDTAQCKVHNYWPESVAAGISRMDLTKQERIPIKLQS
ncbi:unnamed protein product, partial [Nesidiocoris tenuis]